jgi:hypothetical protein
MRSVPLPRRPAVGIATISTPETVASTTGLPHIDRPLEIASIRERGSADKERVDPRASGDDPIGGRHLLAVICGKALVPYFWHRIVYCGDAPYSDRPKAKKSFFGHIGRRLRDIR